MRRSRFFDGERRDGPRGIIIFMREVCFHSTKIRSRHSQFHRTREHRHCLLAWKCSWVRTSLSTMSSSISTLFAFCSSFKRTSSVLSLSTNTTRSLRVCRRLPITSCKPATMHLPCPRKYQSRFLGS